MIDFLITYNVRKQQLPQQILRIELKKNSLNAKIIIKLRLLIKLQNFIHRKIRLNYLSLFKNNFIQYIERGDITEQLDHLGVLPWVELSGRRQHEEVRFYLPDQTQFFTFSTCQASQQAPSSAT